MLSRTGRKFLSIQAQDFIEEVDEASDPGQVAFDS